jgi:hypothetical protein
MYKGNLVVAIKHNNKVLRERGSRVTLPFGAEYSILVKNLNSRKVSVNISIDGEDVLDNKSILIEADSSMELDGFMKGTSAKNRFRFIKKTKQISEYRGDKADDGLIRVEFAFEKEKPVITYHYHEYYDYWPSPKRPCPREPFGPIKYCAYDNSFTSDGISEVAYSCSGDIKASNFSGAKISSKVSSMLADNEDGITVKGEEIDQGFVHGYIGELENSQVMIIHLCGEKTNGTVVSKPVTVKTRLRCKTCGVLSRSSAKFCRNCGTFLE